MKRTWQRLVLVALGIAISGSCTLMTPATVETRKETLTKIPGDVPEGKTHSATLLVFAPETNAVYDTTQMAYETRPYEIAYFSRTEWSARPSQMILPLLVQTMQKGHCFSAVVTPPFMGHYTHTLRTEILALQQNFASEPASLQLDLRVRLIAEASKQVIGAKDISVRELILERTPYAGAVAANEATAKALKEIAEFVREKMA